MVALLNGVTGLTAVLNARLIGMIDRLVAACERHLLAIGIHAPLMVVRGDGALISAAMVRERPIETILSGPAASIVGARWLTATSARSRGTWRPTPDPRPPPLTPKR